MLHERRPVATVHPGSMEQTLAGALTEMITRHACLPISVGVDVVDIPAFSHNECVGGRRWLAKLFTVAELAAAGGCVDRLATGFAGKEAVAKVLQTGFRGVSPREIEVVRTQYGAPRIRLLGRAEQVAIRAGIVAIPVSLSRDGDIAVAVALGLAVAPPILCEEFE